MTENDRSHDTSYETSYDTSYDTGVHGYDAPMVGPLDAPGRRSGFHPVNVGQLVMGIAFAGLVTVWALLEADVVGSDELRWMMPVPWIVAGAIGLAATVWPSRSRSGQ